MASETKPDKISDERWRYWTPRTLGDGPPGVEIGTYEIEYRFVGLDDPWSSGPFYAPISWYPGMDYRYRRRKAARASRALDIQPGGEHYRHRAIQPVEYIHANALPFIEGCVVKYVTRWRDKGGVQDLEKARHYLDLLIELEGKTK
jgi:hypothetical protein